MKYKDDPKAYQKDWYAKNKEKVLTRTKKYYEDNKEKVLTRTKKYYEDNKERVIKRTSYNRRKRLYGVDEVLYENMLIAQDFKCAICLTHVSELSKALSVDHDHNSGKVRGLLCGQCNHAIGLFKDNVETLHRAIEYLKRK